MKKAFLFIAALAMSVSLSAEKITTLAGITSGNKYYVGATTGGNDFYFSVDGSAKTESIKGVAKEDVADAVALTFTAVTSGWTIQFESGLYLGLKNAKDNGAVQVMEEPVVWTIDEDTDKGLLKLHPNDYYLQKNNGGTQFGSYKATQTNVWLESAGAAPTPAILEGIVIKGEASKLEYFVGETFDPAGLEVWGIYTKTVKGDSTSQIKSGITWSYDPEVFALGNTSVAVTATYKDFTSEVFTVNSIVVKEKVVPTGYAGVYTSNVELSTEGGTSASAAKVIIDEDEYEAIKAGTGKVSGACVVTIPANTKTLHFHAAGWKGETVVLNESIELTADDGVSNNSPFTLVNDPATSEYFTLDPKGATTITFTATTGNRFVLFGVNAETGDTPIPPTKELVSLEIGGEATVLAYNVGDKFDVAGLTVVGTYDDASTEDVTSKVTWVIDPETFAEASESASVEVTAKIGAIESAPFQVSGIVVTEKPAPAEKITTIAGITSGNKYYVGATTGDKDYYFYVDGSAKTESIKGVAKEDVADAVALTFTAVTDGWTIQFDNGLYLGLKNAKDNGAVQVMEEAVVWTIEEDADKGLLKLHPNDYYLQKNNSGTQFGSYKATQTNVWLESAGAAPTPAILEGIVIKGEASKLEYFVGETFDPVGLEVWGIYTKTVKGDSTSQIKSGITWSIDPEVFALGNTSVAVTATYKDFTSEVFTVNSIVVKEKVVPTGYAGVYTSNVELSTEGGTSASAAKVIIDEDEYEAIKAGTGKVSGACVVTIPANTKTLHFHAAGWKGETVVLNESIELTADDGVSNNSPFTLVNDPATSEYFTLNPKGATTITFAATAGNRFVLFGVNAETGDTPIPPTKELVSLEIGGEATVLAYNVGDKFDVAGLTVTGTYDDASTEDVTSKVTWIIDPETFAEASESASVEVTAKIGAIESAPFQVSGIVVTEKPAPVEKITTIAGITSGNKYYVGATTGDKDFYFYVDGSAKTESIKGVAVENAADATALKFTAVTDGWTIQFDNGLYLGIKNAKDNGAVQVMEEVVVWTIDEDTDKGLLKLHPNDYYLQKNNNGTQFGSYKNTQTNVWLTPAAEGPVTGIREAMVNANVRKAMVNGRLIIVKGEKAFDLQGRIVK